jgi:hypothetical protein
VQDVRSVDSKCTALLDPEAVLLVDDRQGE